MADVTIRTAVAGDAAGMAKVKVDTWRSTYRGIISDDCLARLSYEENAKRFGDALIHGPAGEYFFVAELGDGIVGFSICGPERDGHGLDGGEIYAIYVAPAYQRHGIGRMLMEAAVAKLRELGFMSMLLWTPDKNPYCGFYERLGGARIAHKKYEVGGAWIDLVAYGWTRFP